MYKPMLSVNAVISENTKTNIVTHVAKPKVTKEAIKKSAVHCLLIDNFQPLVFEMNFQPLCCSG